MRKQADGVPVASCRHRVHLTSSNHDKAETVLVVTSPDIRLVLLRETRTFRARVRDKLRHAATVAWPRLASALAGDGLGQTDRHGPL